MYSDPEDELRENREQVRRGYAAIDALMDNVNPYQEMCACDTPGEHPAKMPLEGPLGMIPDADMRGREDELVDGLDDDLGAGLIDPAGDDGPLLDDVEDALDMGGDGLL